MIDGDERVRCMATAISAMQELQQYRERIGQLKRTEVRRFECMLPDGRICHFSDFIEFLEKGEVVRWMIFRECG